MDSHTQHLSSSNQFRASKRCLLYTRPEVQLPRTPHSKMHDMGDHCPTISSSEACISHTIIEVWGKSQRAMSSLLL